MNRIPAIKVTRDNGMYELLSISLGTFINREFDEQFTDLNSPIFDGAQLDMIEPFPLSLVFKYKSDLTEAMEEENIM